MPGGLSRRTLAVAALVFAGALGVGYVVSSPGSAEPAPEPLGATAVPLDVPAAPGADASLGKVEGLPALAREPEPPPPEPVDEEPAEEPVEPDPVDEVPFVPPTPPPTPVPPPPPPQDPVDFDDSG